MDLSSDDIEVLNRYRDGDVIGEADQAAMNRLASIGFAKLGVHVEIRNGKARLRPTARATSLGRRMILLE